MSSSSRLSKLSFIISTPPIPAFPPTASCRWCRNAPCALPPCMGACCHSIIVLSLHVVKCILTVGCSLAVSIVKSIPLNLAVLLIAPPVHSCLPIRESLCCTIACIALIPHVIVATWKVLPIVRLWVFAVVIVQLSALIHRILSKKTCCQLHLFIDIPIPSEDSRRSEVVYNTAIAFVTILITSLGIGISTKR